MLYTIGDLHLSFGADKPMDVFGAEWENHAEKLRENFKAVSPEDTTVIAGDMTWGMSLNDCLEDFRFIHELPGKKIILKGNHDFWWSTASKAMSFFREHGLDSIEILNNNCFFCIVCFIFRFGTIGCFCIGSLSIVYNRILYTGRYISGVFICNGIFLYISFFTFLNRFCL